MKICKGCKTAADKAIKKEVKKIQVSKTLNKINNMQTRPLMKKLPSPVVSSNLITQTRPLAIDPDNAQVSSKNKINQLIIGGLIALWLIKNK